MLLDSWELDLDGDAVPLRQPKHQALKPGLDIDELEIEKPFNVCDGPLDPARGAPASADAPYRSPASERFGRRPAPWSRARRDHNAARSAPAAQSRLNRRTDSQLIGFAEDQVIALCEAILADHPAPP
ncbi:MAG: hypothetical protein ACREPI_09575 [Candidatus Dormibacterales bacterium]